VEKSSQTLSSPSDRLANMLTISLNSHHIDHICNKFGSYDIYAPA